MSETVKCRGCGREEQRAEGKTPNGWYNLSVSVPLWFNAESNRPYRWIGLFCSVDCLVGHESTLRLDQELMRHAYSES